MPPGLDSPLPCHGKNLGPRFLFQRLPKCRMPAQPRYKTVSQLTQEIQDTLECDFSQVTLCGEVSGFHAHRSGHWYLTLKDKKAQISAVVWRSTAVQQKVAVEDGLEVVVRGRVTVYAPRGNYQLIIDRIEPLGEGAWRAAFRKLHQKLAAEGLFAPERKRSLPAIPQRVVAITSPSSAAIRDFLQVATRRWQGSEIYILPTRVQGEGAGVQLAAAIDLAQQLSPAPDVIVLTRGGGSVEDLWEFNHESLIRAIAECTIPVVSGVGHEIDVTLCDLAADLRALTPSEAAERVFPDQAMLRAGLDQARQLLQQHLLRQWRSAKEEVDRLAVCRVLSQPMTPIREQAQRLDEWAERLDRAVSTQRERAEKEVSALAAQLQSLSPLNVLARGYSVTLDQEGQAIEAATELKVGQKITTRLRQGAVLSEVVSVAPPDSEWS